MADARPSDSAPPGTGGPDLSSGSTIAGYVIEERLGAGGMAVVYRAVDQRLGRPVALKILARQLAADDAFRHRFVRESRTAAAVDDPHIIPVFEAGEADGVLFIAMRYVPGGDVYSLVRENGPLPRERAALILSQVASALDAAHRRGLVHRDVKPANMLMDVSGDRPDHIYLSDFGLSKLAISGSALTGTGMFLGTLDYVAPEQIDGQPVSGQADQYALACSAFELLSGTPPFPRDQPMPLIWAHMSEPPPSLAGRRPDLPARVDYVLGRALAKSPAERYGTCREFTDALREAIGLPPYDSGGRAIPAVPRTPTAAAFSPPAATPPYAATAPPHAAASPGGLAPSSVADYPTAAASGPGTLGPAPTDRNTRPISERTSRRWPLIFAGMCVLAAAGVVGGALVVSSAGNRAAGPAGGAAASGTPAARGRDSSSSAPGPSHFALLHNLDPGGGQGVNALAFSSLGSLATAGDSGIVHVWNPGTGHQQDAIATNSLSPVKAVAFSPDGRTLAAGDVSGHVYLWDPATGVLRVTLTDPGSAQIESAAFSPNGRILATGDGTGVTYFWDAATGRQVAALADPGSKGVDTLAFSPDGTMLATGDYNGTTYLWKVATRTRIRKFPAPFASDILSVAFSPAGSTLATGAYDGSTCLWNVTTGSRVAVLSDPGPHVAVETLAFDPDARMLATGDVNGNTYLWNISTGRYVQVLPSAGKVWAVGFSANGALLAVADHDASTDIWRTG